MKITNCKNCPFRISVFNDWSFSYDTADICALHFNSELVGLPKEKKESLIRQFNESEDELIQEVVPPDWCPLKQTGGLDIRFDFNK